MNISVIIPLYNSEDTIIQAINSILKQTYETQLEIIIVNDGSKDNSLQVVTDFCRDLPNVIIIDQANGGAQMARNAGLRIAKGDWIALLDADDCWLPNKLEKQFEILNDNIHIDFLGCNRNDEVIKVLWSKKDKLSKIEFKDLLVKMYPQTSTVVFKRNVLNDVGLYDETLRYGEDGDYWLRISLKKQMYFMPDSLVITGNGKPSFGFSGMTANLAKMEKGNNYVLYKNLMLKNINIMDFALLKGFYFIKYLRRLLITKIR
ncbi:glycosyltransferase family 2 protein [Mucilaginibacter sp.]|jgi:glycosyltransferase involved in cell wall biosynthesis|uniref:glycosyltransferase family 2 protein n=1 Tax=Mucilaginibacter sp. TaxID=1882438 RepID=UPI0035628129